MVHCNTEIKHQHILFLLSTFSAVNLFFFNFLSFSQTKQFCTVIQCCFVMNLFLMTSHWQYSRVTSQCPKMSDIKKRCLAGTIYHRLMIEWNQSLSLVCTLKFVAYVSSVFFWSTRPKFEANYKNCTSAVPNDSEWVKYVILIRQIMRIRIRFSEWLELNSFCNNTITHSRRIDYGKCTQNKHEMSAKETTSFTHTE